MIRGVNCRTCGETNFVELDDYLVQVAVPVDAYPNVIKAISRAMSPRRTRQKEDSPDAIALLVKLRGDGLSWRAVAEAMNLPLASVYRMGTRTKK